MSNDKRYIGAFVTWIEEWSQLTPHWNWRTFHPVMIGIEDDRIMGAVELTVILFGLGVCLRWNYKVTQRVEEIHRAVRQIEAGEVATITLDEMKPKVTK